VRRECPPSGALRHPLRAMRRRSWRAMESHKSACIPINELQNARVYLFKRPLIPLNRPESGIG